MDGIDILLSCSAKEFTPTFSGSSGGMAVDMHSSRFRLGLGLNDNQSSYDLYNSGSMQGGFDANPNPNSGYEDGHGQSLS